MANLTQLPWRRMLAWAVALGLLAGLLADWGEWDRFLPNTLWRILIVGAGGIGGLILNYFAGGYVGIGTNVIESMGIIKFSDDSRQKIANAFIFVGSLLGAIVALLVIK